MMTTKKLKAIRRHKQFLKVTNTNKNLPRRILRGLPNFRSAKICSIISKAGYQVLQAHTPLRFKK